MNFLTDITPSMITASNNVCIITEIEEKIRERNLNSEYCKAVEETDSSYVFQCPHCDLFIEVMKGEVNCSIFRHGYYYNLDERGNVILTQQVNPHLPKESCDDLVGRKAVIGCCRPFRMVKTGDSYCVEICDYI